MSIYAPGNPNRKLFDLTKDRIAHLNACAAQNLSMAAACKELGIDPKTLKNAAERQGLTAWLKRKFPGSGYAVDRSKPAAQPARESLHFRAATMPWRKCA